MEERRSATWTRKDWFTLSAIFAPVIMGLAGWAVHVETKLAVVDGKLETQQTISQNTNDSVHRIEVTLDKITQVVVKK